MSKLDDIEHAVDEASAKAQEDITRLTGLVTEAVQMIVDLKAGTDPAHADVVIHKIETLRDTLSSVANTAMDPLDQVLHPAPVV